MATYAELRGLFGHNELKNKVEVACIVAAETIRGEDPGVANHTNRLLWAKAAFASPRNVAGQMVKALLAANKDAATTAITGATDAAIQTKVDAAIDLFADGS